MTRMKKRKVLLKELRPHEETDSDKVEELAEDIRRNGLENPLLVDANFLIILDGHHRAKALETNGKAFADAVLVDYFSEEVRLSGRRPDVPVSKELVVARALEGKPFPPKTTRHEFKSTFK